MASSTFITLQRTHLISITLCKYPSSFHTVSFHCHLSHFLTFSPSKHAPLFARSDSAHVNNTNTKLSTINHQNPIKTMNSRTRKEIGSGFSSLRTGGERVGEQSLNNLVSSLVEEKKIEKRFTKDRNSRKDMGFVKRMDLGYGNSSVTCKAGNRETKCLESEDTQVANDKVQKKNKHRGKVKEEKFAKGSKRNKPDSPEMQFRLRLDMCSKRGDVMGAIQSYDLAQREGIKMGQYHYTVLLYLCSSAAVGVVQVAKSGSGGRTLNALEVSSEVTSDRIIGTTESDPKVANNGQRLIYTSGNSESKDKVELNSSGWFDDSDDTFNGKKSLPQSSNDIPRKGNNSETHDDHEIKVTEDIKKYALERGFEIYEKMCMDKIPMNEATLTSVARMAMSMGNGDMAFNMVKQTKSLGLNPRLRSYGPALFAFCNIGDVNKAFAVEKHMLEHGVYPEEPELEAILRVSVEAGEGDKVYYLLQKLRTSVRKVSPSTADIIVRWFKSKAASRVGKTKWNKRVIKEAIENGGGGWHGQGWLGKGKWNISFTSVGSDALCRSCGEKLVTIDLDPTETDNFAESVASIAIKKDKDASFQKFQKWLDYYGPFEAVIDGANVGLMNQNRFIPSKINTIANGIRQKLPSKRWPLIVLHNKRVNGHKMNEPVNKALVEKWKNADALYATPTGSNDDWYWLYAAIKFKCLAVTNDEMRDHTFQLLGNDFFPKWKERHQESEKGYWHIPIAADNNFESERAWLCITRGNSSEAKHDSVITTREVSQSVDNSDRQAKLTTQTRAKSKQNTLKHGGKEGLQNSPGEVYKNLRNILSASGFTDHYTILSDIEASEKLGDCVIDFQI